MSKKIDESFFTQFAGNIAAAIAGKALATNGDKIKQALGIDSKEFDDIDDEIEAVRKAEVKLAKELEKKLAVMPPDKQKRMIKIYKQMGIKL
jgi:hypothetical protein